MTAVRPDAVALALLLLAGCGQPPGPASPESGRGEAATSAGPAPDGRARATAGATPAAAPPATSTEPPSPTAEPASVLTEPSEAAPGAPPSEERAEQPPSAPELPTGTTILHIGDSFAGALGIDLNRELKAAGIRGVLKYQTATYIPTWASGKDLDKYLWQYHPDLVLITLGANELEIPDPAQRAPTIRRLVGRLGGRPCVWVAPPLWHGARPALLDTIRASCAPCVYLDSTALVPDLPRARDGIHPSMEARKEWARAVLGWLRVHRVAGGAASWTLRP